MQQPFARGTRLGYPNTNKKFDHQSYSSLPRLLWRGSLQVSSDITLHGLAIITHVFHLDGEDSENPFAQPTAAEGTSHITTSTSTNEDPLGSFDTQTNNSTDLCLDIEMLRHADLHLVKHVSINPGSPTSKTDQVIPTSSRGRKGLKERIEALRKGNVKASNNISHPLEFINIEADADVRLYLDSRCPATVEWFTNTFCKDNLTQDGRSRNAILLSTGESSSFNLVAFGQLFKTPDNSNGLCLYIGRRKTQGPPRPDDPLPRDNLFAQKLRQSSQASLFSKSNLYTSTSSSLSSSSIVSHNRKSTKRKRPSNPPTENDAEMDPDIALPPSPTPTLNSTNRNSKRRSSTTASSSSLERNGLLSRSASLPAAKFSTAIKPSPSADATNSATTAANASSKEEQNKITIRSAAMNALSSKGLKKSSSEFREMYTMICKGTQFALRHDMKNKSVNIDIVKYLVQQHISMYLVS